MSTITLQNFRVGSDLTVKVRLKDGGVAIDWSTLSGIRAVLYSDAQSSIAGRCDVTVDGEDPTLLVCRYAATKMQYLGVNRIVVSAKYMGETKTYDKPAFTFVRWTADQEGEQITIEDPEVTVEINVEDVSSSILQEAVDAAFSAADRANEAAAAAEHMVDIHTGPEGKSAYEVAVEEGYTGTEEEWLASLKGPVGETPDISIGTVTTVDPGEPAAASMSGTPEAPVLNLSIPKGLVGATPNFTVGEVTTGQPGTPVVITITGTAEAPVLNVQIPQGMKGDTGVSADYPITIHNGLDSDATDEALAAFQGKVLDGKISQLQQEADGMAENFDAIPTRNLFDASKVTSNKYVRKDLGTLTTSSDWVASDYIDISAVPVGEDVKTLKTGSYSGVIGTAFYDANKVYTHGGTASVAKQEGDVFYRGSIPATELATAMIVVGDNPSSYIPYGYDYVLKDKIITKDKLADDVIEDSIATEEIHYGYNRMDSSTNVHGYINKSTGAFVTLAAGTSDNILATDFIPVSSNGLFCFCRAPYGSVGDGAVYDADKKYLRALTAQKYIYVEGDAFVRWTISTSYNANVVIELVHGDEITLRTPIPSYTPPQTIVKLVPNLIVPKDNAPDFYPALSLAGHDGLSAESETLADGSLELDGWPLYIKDNGIVTAFAKIVSFAGIDVGIGLNQDDIGYFVRVTDTEVSLRKFYNGSSVQIGSASAHGLTVSGFVNVAMTYSKGTVTARVTTPSGTFNATFDADKWEKYGVPFVSASSGSSFTGVVLRGCCKLFKCPIWVVGDSYMTMSESRWPYQLLQNYGFSQFMVDGDAGAGSSRMLAELQRLLNFGTPKFLVWAIGMNDAYLQYYVEALYAIERICRVNGIELILTTIPWPTNGDKSSINNYIKASGHRYIDIYSAVSADDSGTWYDGMNADGVHPTALGAKAIASKVLQDFPEIATL